MTVATRWFFVGALAVASVSVAGWSKQGNASASFKAVGPAGLKIIGNANTVDVADDGKALTITVKLADIDTDNSLRNKHMLEDLEAAKFATVSLSVPVDSIKEGATNAEGKGTFTLHGKSKEVAFKYTTTCAAGACDVEGSADLNLKDFDVKVRSYLGVTVKPDITVSTKFHIKK